MYVADLRSRSLLDVRFALPCDAARRGVARRHRRVVKGEHRHGLFRVFPGGSGSADRQVAPSLGISNGAISSTTSRARALGRIGTRLRYSATARLGGAVRVAPQYAPVRLLRFRQSPNRAWAQQRSARPTEESSRRVRTPNPSSHVAGIAPIHRRVLRPDRTGAPVADGMLALLVVSSATHTSRQGEPTTRRRRRYADASSKTAK